MRLQSVRERNEQGGNDDLPRAAAGGSVVVTAIKRRNIRIALLADTHGFVDPRVLEVAATCELVVHAGDVGDGAVLARMRRAGSAVRAVRGNNDTPEKWPRGQRRVLRRLPERIQLALPGGVLVVVHGDRVLPAAGRHVKLRRLYPHARAIVYGHTHRLVCDRDAVPWILNPGAAGRARTFGGPSCILLKIGGRGWRVQPQRFP